MSWLNGAGPTISGNDQTAPTPSSAPTPGACSPPRHTRRPMPSHATHRAATPSQKKWWIHGRDTGRSTIQNHGIGLCSSSSVAVVVSRAEPASPRPTQPHPRWRYRPDGDSVGEIRAPSGRAAVRTPLEVRESCLAIPLRRGKDHAGGDGVVGRLVDQDEAAGGAVARVRVDDQRVPSCAACTRPISLSPSCWPAPCSSVLTSTRYSSSSMIARAERVVCLIA